MTANEIDNVLETLAKDVESAVHALYRGEVRQMTAKARTVGMVRDARAALEALLPDRVLPASGRASSQVAAPPGAASPGAASPRPPVAAPTPTGGAAGWTREQGEAVMKCITAWLPVGPPTTTDPASKCITAMKDLVPTWGQRETAREAVKRISHP